MVRYSTIIILLFIGSWTLAWAGGSIYGANGLGETLPPGGTRAAGLAAGGLALADSQGANFSNPALLGLIERTQVRLGGRMAFWSTTSAGETDADADAGIQEFYLCFPLSSIWKFGFGFIPMRQMDIRTFEWKTTGAQTYEERTRSSGGEAEVQIVNAFKFSPRFSIGVAVGYAFRRYERWTIIDFQSSDWQDAEFHFDDSWRGWATTIGLVYQPHPNLSLGVLYHPRLDGNWTTQFSYSEQDSVDEAEKSGRSPGEWGAGAALRFAKRWMVVGDARAGLWQEGDLGPRDTRTPVNPLWLSVGVERLALTKTRISSFEKWGYRAGFFYRKHYWPEQNGETVLDFGGTAGVTIPAPEQRGFLHLAAEVGKRGSEEFGAEETFFRFSLMLEAHESWFKRPKPRLPNP